MFIIANTSKSESEDILEWMHDLQRGLMDRACIFLVAPEDTRLDNARLAVLDVFGPKYTIVTADDIPSFEDNLKEITRRIHDSCLVIVIYAKCREGRRLRLPRDNIAFELGVGFGIGVPMIMLLDAKIDRTELEREFSDVKGRNIDKANVLSREKMAKKLRSEYDKKKPMVVEWLVRNWLPVGLEKRSLAEQSEFSNRLERLAREYVEI